MKRRCCSSENRNFGRMMAGLLLLLSLALLNCAHVPEAPSRLVAIGDVHGAFKKFTVILQAANLIDETFQWTGGNATLVQVGDIMDRGSDVKQVMDLLMALEKQAIKQGGRVITLMGNHESYNLMGYYDRQSTPLPVFTRIWAGFAGADSESRRQSAYREYETWKSRFPQCGTVSRTEWMNAHPPGFIEYQEALSSTGPYGRWLRRRPAVVRIGGILFVHGGLSPELVRLEYDTPTKVNHRLETETKNYDQARRDLLGEGLILPFSTMDEIECAVDQAISEIAADETNKELSGERDRISSISKNLPRTQAWMQLNGDGPLWFRGYARWTEEEGNPRIDEILEAWEIERIVVGHTPTPTGRIRNRFNNRVFLIDTGMVYGTTSRFKGRPSALEIRGNQYTAIYEDGRTLLSGNSMDPKGISPPTDEKRDPVRDKIEPLKALLDYPQEASRGIEKTYLGPDGNHLPFETEDEVLDFLRTARVQGTVNITTGVTRPKKLLLEKDGVTAHAIFHYRHELDRGVNLKGGGRVKHFRDSYRNQVAAYEVSRLLGIKNVSPTVLRPINGKMGSVQLWIENAFNERDRIKEGRVPPDIAMIELYAHDMRVFDNLINNIDRNQTNILYDSNWQLWYIDHTRAFGQEKKLPNPEKLRRCSVSLWEKLQTLDADLLVKALGPYMRKVEIEAVIARREIIVAHLQDKIETEGKETVLFEYPSPR